MTGLSPNTTYEWWVQARNDYAWGDDSAHWTFTTGPSGALISAGPSSPTPQHREHVVTDRDDGTTFFEEEQNED